MEFVIVTGMSGAGKSHAGNCMEDMGFFCVDNLPVPLIGKFAELGMGGTSEYERMALIVDVRAGAAFESLTHVLDELERAHCPLRILFMDAADSTIIKRYKETRRSHPLAAETDSLEAAIAAERALLEPLRERADWVVDTSDLPKLKLKDMLQKIFRTGDGRTDEMRVNMTSFGFKYGVPPEADLVFDVRFMANPHYDPLLRPYTGLEQPVADYVFADHNAAEFMDRMSDMLRFLLPRYKEEGKSALFIAIGCTGGRHRSVAVAHRLAEFVADCGYPVSENHRDMLRN
ncbi:MAG: RNase adapter RapZ [Oscillospiraceae bacterium]|nr:RNase adapter RapZ [Oscillospiraceae bacterium]